MCTMLKRWRCVMLCVVLVGALTLPVSAEQEVTMECKYVAGQRFLVAGTMTIDGTVAVEGLPPRAMSPMGTTTRMNQKVSFETEQNVEDVDSDGMATLTTKFKSMQSENETSDQHVVTTIDESGMKVVANGQIIVDTSQSGMAGPGGQEGGRLIEQLITDTTTIKVRRDGSITEVSGGSAEAMLGQGNTPGQWSRMSHVSLPKGPVAVGSTWEASQDLSKMLGVPEGKGTMRSTCLLESIEVTETDRLAHIKQDIDVKLTDWSPELPAAGADTETMPGMPQMKFAELGVKGVIRSTFAIDAGRLVKTEMDIVQHMESEIGADATGGQAPPGAGPVNMVTDMHMVGTVTISPAEQRVEPVL